MTDDDKLALTETVIQEFRPMLQRDGGDCQLVDVEDNRVLVKLTGACIDCQMASVTISGVQERLVQKLGLPLRVIPVK